MGKLPMSQQGTRFRLRVLRVLRGDPFLGALAHRRCSYNRLRGSEAADANRHFWLDLWSMAGHVLPAEISAEARAGVRVAAGEFNRDQRVVLLPANAQELSD